jgi:hypothetical protein
MSIVALATYKTAKRAALLFDKVLLNATDYYVEKIGGMLRLPAIFNAGIIAAPDPVELQQEIRTQIEQLRQRGMSVVPVYDGADDFESDFPPGQRLAYCAALQNIPIVVETEVEWEQVVEFKFDPDAQWKYRRLRTWLREFSDCESLEQAMDEIGRKIDDYSWAMRKHGFQTIQGAFSVIFDSKHLPTLIAGSGAAALIGGPTWSALTAGLLLTSQVALKMADSMITLEDVKRGENSEIAILYDTRKLAKRA